MSQSQSQLVTVFNASSRQGLAQVGQLLRAGHRPRAVTRQPALFVADEFKGVETVVADTGDPASLDRALAGADGVFFQPPLLDLPDRLRAATRNVGAAAKRAGIRRFIHNSTMWSPDPADYPCGQATYDLMRELEMILEGLDLPLVIFRPTLFMDNWLTSYALPVLLTQHLYRYPHKPALRFCPISLDDVARFMIAALDRDDLPGARLRIAGPEVLSPEDIRAALSDAMGVEIRYEYISPADFGADTFDRFIHRTGADRAGYIAAFADFYSFNNDSVLRPFLFDVTPVLAQIPLQLETFRDWAKRQDWRAVATPGSISG